MSEIVFSRDREEAITEMRSEGLTAEYVARAETESTKILSQLVEADLKSMVFEVQNVVVAEVTLTTYEFKPTGRGKNAAGDLILFDGSGNYLNVTAYFNLALALAREALS